MLGRKDRQQELFITGSIWRIIPEDHILVKVDKVLDLSWIYDEVKDLYCNDNGRPSIDPEAALRLMLAGFLHNIVHDRALMREAQVNLAIRWFAGFGLQETMPDHSTLTRLRQRWGEERFKGIFRRTVEACQKAGLVGGKTLHMDATLIRADVSWESLTDEYVSDVIRANREEDDDPPENCGIAAGSKPIRSGAKTKKRSSTDPDASMATSRRDHHLEPTYKQHTAVDDLAGVIVGIAVTTGEANEGLQMESLIDDARQAIGAKPEVVTADCGYAHSKNYAWLERHEIQAIITPQKEGARPGHIPLSRFKYDGKRQIVRCPGGKALHKSHRLPMKGWIYRAAAADCRACDLRHRCFSKTARARTVLIVDGYEALLRARRQWARWGDAERMLYRRHRWRSEGANAEAKTRHGLRRAVRRGLPNVSIQAYLTAAAMNLKRLAALFLLFALVQRLRKRKSSPII